MAVGNIVFKNGFVTHLFLKISMTKLLFIRNYKTSNCGLVLGTLLFLSDGDPSSYPVIRLGEKYEQRGPIFAVYSLKLVKWLTRTRLKQFEQKLMPTDGENPSFIGSFYPVVKYLQVFPKTVYSKPQLIVKLR